MLMMRVQKKLPNEADLTLFTPPACRPCAYLTNDLDAIGPNRERHHHNRFRSKKLSRVHYSSGFRKWILSETSIIFPKVDLSELSVNKEAMKFLLHNVFSSPRDSIVNDKNKIEVGSFLFGYFGTLGLATHIQNLNMEKLRGSFREQVSSSSNDARRAVCNHNLGFHRRIGNQRCWDLAWNELE